MRAMLDYSLIDDEQYTPRPGDRVEFELALNDKGMIHLNASRAVLIQRLGKTCVKIVRL